MDSANLSWLEQLYALYQLHPEQVDPSWRQFFAGQVDQGSQAPVSVSPAATQVAATQVQAEQLVESRPQLVGPAGMADGQAAAARIMRLIDRYREEGHLAAHVNPIAKNPDKPIAQLELSTLGFREEELGQQFPTLGLLDRPMATLAEIVAVLQEIYCDGIGVEYMGNRRPDMEQWLQQRVEPTRLRPQLTADDRRLILEYLNKSELLEMFIHTKFVGQKRFSLEGGETLIPMLAAIVERGAEQGIEEIVIGMAHRGRLNVLTNILGKSYGVVFHEFEDTYHWQSSFGGGGDVKYHKGFTGKVTTRAGHQVQLVLCPNASHLESVDPIVLGMTRAKQIQRGDEKEQRKVLAILIHGDAALAGQGVVYESLQFSQLAGYSTGGTIHIVVNNQIGFTTIPKDSRSTRYCTDIARAFSAPVFHVNGEDPEGCIYATNLAVEMRQTFHCDLFLELNCYRKYGHNESDEPAFTQPLEYQLIRSKKPVRELYREQLIHEGVVEKVIAESLETQFRDALEKELSEIRKTGQAGELAPVPMIEEWPAPQLESFLTGVELRQLQEMSERFTRLPTGFNPHKKVEKLLEDRRAMVHAAPDQPVIDWGMGEHLAFASLLWEGRAIRLSGQDCRRGTFSQRHAMLVDQTNSSKYFPLNHLKPDQGRFDVFNSHLSEFGVMGFDLGYSWASPETLVIWEAQFGDFANGAQIIIDQYLTAAEQKWGQGSNMALFLPHGYEGQGPEHSSGRIERFLQLSGHHNIDVVSPSTPAQLFHLIRRQALRKAPKPLIVFTPKELLRHPLCRSSLNELTSGQWETVLDDPTPAIKTRRLVLCHGHITYALLAERQKRKADDMTILRIEQLFPLDLERLAELIQKYAGFESVYWVQEEPSNMGAWDFVRNRLRQILPNHQPPLYVGRRRSASTATGSHTFHELEHHQILERLFG
jgi:2-oxoglutarate dehydrogenase E1 component